jgi:hypothetical protein
VSEGEADLRAILETLDPNARVAFRRVLIHDQADRDAVASQLLRYGDGRDDDWADIIDLLSMYPDARRRVVRALGELTAKTDPYAVPDTEARWSVLSLFLSPRKHRSKGICAGRAHLTRSRVRR